MALFRVDFSGRGELAERQQKLAQMLSRLQKISEGVRECSLHVTTTAATNRLKYEYSIKVLPLIIMINLGF